MGNGDMANAVAQWLRDTFATPSFAGTIVGVLVGGAITLLGQRVTIFETRKHRADDRRVHQIAKCSSLLIKLIEVSTNIFRGSEAFRAAIDEAGQRKADTSQPWLFCREIANPGNDIKFEAEELGVMLQLSEKDVFNAIGSIDNLNNTFIALLRLYNDRRKTLVSRLTPKEFDSNTGIGSGEFTQEEMLKLAPYMHECNALISDRIAFGVQVEHVKAATAALLGMMSRRLNHKMELAWEQSVHS